MHRKNQQGWTVQLHIALTCSYIFWQVHFRLCWTLCHRFPTEAWVEHRRHTLVLMLEMLQIIDKDVWHFFLIKLRQPMWMNGILLLFLCSTTYTLVLSLKKLNYLFTLLFMSWPRTNETCRLQIFSLDVQSDRKRAFKFVLC